MLARKRLLFVVPEIEATLQGAGPPGFPEAEATSVNDRFMVGHVISISRERRRTAVLKKVEGVDAVWSLSYRKPKPGWRLLGRFLERDVFVGLSLQPRARLGADATAFTVAAQAVVSHWQALFPGLDPESSDAADDMLSPLYWDLDDDEET